MATTDNQLTLRLAFGVHHAAKEAPSKLVRLIDNDAQAIAVCMQASKLKASYVASLINKSEGYVSRLRNGKRDVPEALVDVLCGALGSRLLRQVRDLREAMDGDGEIKRLAEMLREAA